LGPLVPTGNPAESANQVVPAHLEKQEIQARKDHPEPRAHPRLPWVQPDQRDRPAQPDHQALLETQADPAKTAIPDHPDPPVTKEPAADPEPPGNPGDPVPLATPDPRDLATNARRLVWPPAIRPLPSALEKIARNGVLTTFLYIFMLNLRTNENKPEKKNTC